MRAMSRIGGCSTQPESETFSRTSTGAALGHPLARALERLGLCRLQEAAGQTAVRGVAGQLLQPGVVVVIEVDVEVPEPGDGEPVVRQVLVGRGHGGGLDVGAVRGQAEDRPGARHELGGDGGAGDLQQLLRDPARDGLIVRHVHGPDQVEDQPGRVGHAQRVLTEGPQGDNQAGHRVLDLVQPAAETAMRELAGADEVDLGLEGIAARPPVHEHPQERELLGIEGVLPGREHAHDLPRAHEHGHGVGLDDGPGELADVVVRPLVDDLALRAVGRRDEFTACLVEDAHRIAPPSSSATRSAPRPLPPGIILRQEVFRASSLGTAAIDYAGAGAGTPAAACPWRRMPPAAAAGHPIGSCQIPIGAAGRRHAVLHDRRI